MPVSFLLVFLSESKLTPMLFSHKWKVWANTPHGGVTTTIRRHLAKHHAKEYCDALKLHNLKHAGEYRLNADGEAVKTFSIKDFFGDLGPFTLEGFLKIFIQWVVSDDQVSCFLSLIKSMTELFYV
jgi:hypothetical protein